MWCAARENDGWLIPRRKFDPESDEYRAGDAVDPQAGASVALQSILRDLKKDLHDPYEKIDGKRRPQEQLIAQLCAAYEEAADEVSDNWLSNFIPDDKE